MYCSDPSRALFLNRDNRSKEGKIGREMRKNLGIDLTLILQAAAACGCNVFGQLGQIFRVRFSGWPGYAAGCGPD